MKTLNIVSATLLLAATTTAQWATITPTTSPLGRGGMAMAYNPGTGNTIMFGGDTLGFPAGTVNETWSYDGSDWTLLTPTASPAARAGIKIAYDVAGGVMVMYGGGPPGFFGGPATDETWTFDGTTWTQVFPTTTPGGLVLYSMTYDIARSRTVVYGGQPDTFFPIDSDKTWEWNGTDWTEIVGANQPGPLERAAMCYRSGIARTVMFGGIDPQTGGVNTVWLFDGTAWTAAPITGTAPVARTGAVMSYDDTTDLIVMSGGQDFTNGTPYNDTWHLNLTTNTWAMSPSTRANAHLDGGQVYDSVRQKTVGFGGYNFQTFVAYDTTEEYGATKSTFGTGCAGSNGTPALDSNGAPRLGSTFDLNATNIATAANLAVFAQSLSSVAPIALDPIGMIGCTAYVAPTVLTSVTGTAGSATLSITLPSTAALVGTVLNSQVLSFDPNINARWLTASNGHTGTLGL